MKNYFSVKKCLIVNAKNLAIFSDYLCDREVFSMKGFVTLFRKIINLAQLNLSAFRNTLKTGKMLFTSVVDPDPYVSGPPRFRSGSIIICTDPDLFVTSI